MTIDDQFQFEFQSIIFAAGKGSRMTQLLNGKPKCLLPICNKPMIQYPLEILIKSKIKETIIIVLDTEEETIRSSIHRLNLDIQIDYISISSVNDYATADSLRIIKEKIKKDLLILPCDIIFDANLTDFIQFYRLKNATFLCLLSSIPHEKENLIPAKKLIDNKEFDFIGFDFNDSNRLAFFEPDIMFTDSVPLKKSLLLKCSHFEMQTNLLDTHIYLMKNWILDYLDVKQNIKSVKGDFIPSIVRKQFRTSEPKAKCKTNSIHLIDYAKTNSVEQKLEELDKLDLDMPLISKQYPKSIVKCYGYIVDSGYCIRANSWTGFCESNRVISKRNQLPSKLSNMPRMIGNGTVLGEKCAIKRTIVGSNCNIGDRVKLTNCIVLDNVTIEEGCSLQGSILCYDVFVGNNAEIKDCIIGPGQKITALSRYSNESLTEEMLDL